MQSQTLLKTEVPVLSCVMCEVSRVCLRSFSLQSTLQTEVPVLSSRVEGRKKVSQGQSGFARVNKVTSASLGYSDSVLSKTAIFPQKEGRKREISLHGVRRSARPTSR